MLTLERPQSGYPSTLGASEKPPESRKQLQLVPVTISVGESDYWCFLGPDLPERCKFTMPYFIASNEALGEVL